MPLLIAICIQTNCKMVQQNYSSQTLLEKKFNLMCVYEYLHNFQKVNSSKSVDFNERLEHAVD